MELSTDTRQQIATRSQGLAERLVTDPGDIQTVEAEHAQRLLGEWRNCFTTDEWGERLSRVNLTTRECQTRLRRPTVTDGPPQWTDYLSELVDSLTGYEPSVADGDNPWDSSEPFVHVTGPIAAHAADRVDWPTWLSDDAVNDLRAELTDRLGNLFVHPLFVDYKYELRQNGVDDEDLSTSSTDHYTTFLSGLFADGCASFFEEYALLARLTVTLSEQWIDRCREFCRRFDADRDRLQSVFGGSFDSVTGIDVLGDEHARSRRVFGVETASGTRVAYKPRDVGPEVWSGELLERVDSATTTPSLLCPRVVQCDGYGWVEWVEPDSCSSRHEVERFYERLGVLTSLLYGVDFTDGHLENLIAAGEHPVVVDLETVGQPVLAAGLTDTPRSQAVRDSVLSTGLIPTYFPDAPLQNSAGMNPDQAIHTDTQRATVQHPNTDAMELSFQTEVAVDGDNLPTLDGRVCPPGEFHQQLLDGFETGYRYLCSMRGTQSTDDWLTQLADTSVRVLVRSTRRYAAARLNIREASSLRTGVAMGREIERLAPPVVDDENWWRVFEHERVALNRYDVPRFTVQGDERRLRHDGEPVAELADATPRERVERRLDSLCESDLREQLDYLRLAFDTDSLAHPSPAAPRPPDVGSDHSTTRARWVDDAYRRLVAGEKTAADGSPTWLVRDHRTTATGSGVHVGELPDTLYYGRLGVAVFLAALTACDELDRNSLSVADLVDPIRAELLSDNPYPDLGVGGGAGLGSLVYGLTRVGTILGESRYVDLACEAAALIDDARLQADETYDVLRGAAGAILGLLTAYDARGSDVLLEQACAAGDRLLNAAIVDDDNRWFWRTIQPEPLYGVSHGVGGIGYALARLAARTDDDSYWSAARGAFAFEHAGYDETLHSWPDRRAGTPFESTSGWCTGADGVALTRLDLLQRGATAGLDETQLRNDFDRALAATADTPGQFDGGLCDRDHLCCGTFGRVALYRRAARAECVDGPTPAAAKRLTDAALQRAARNGQLALSWTNHRWDNVGLFTGTTGVGYELLRQTTPGLPCPLLFE